MLKTLSQYLPLGAEMEKKKQEIPGTYLQISWQILNSGYG
jgi:hypothetical protein